LENPNDFHFEQDMPFVGFIVKEYCEHHMDENNIEPTLKQQVLSNLLDICRQRKVNDKCNICRRF